MDTKHVYKKLYRWIPYKKMKDAIFVTFHFTSMTNEEAWGIHNALEASFTCPTVDPAAKTATGNFFKEGFDQNTIITDLQKKGFSVVPDKVDIGPSTEHSLNCISVLILMVITYLLFRWLR